MQKTRLVANAEEYYRSMYLGAKSSWSLRYSHMFETFKSLLDFGGEDAKAVVWAHNSHIGDASATEMGAARGEHNIGQLVREEFGDKSYNIGFGTDHGTVGAAHNRGGKMRIMDIRPSPDQSVEKLMHQVSVNRFMLPLKKGIDKELNKKLMEPMLERAIGVIYRSKTEEQSHYFQTSLYNQFDEYIWLDETSAVNYKEIIPQREGAKKGVAQTYPFGL